jgi:hypothetical protein
MFFTGIVPLQFIMSKKDPKTGGKLAMEEKLAKSGQEA